MQWLRSRSGLGHWVRTVSVLAVLLVAVTVAAVWLLRPSDPGAFCTRAVAIQNQAAAPVYAGFPEYGPLVQLALATLSPRDTLRIRAAVKEAEETHTDELTYQTIAVGEQLTRLCPDHEVYSVVAVP